MMCVVSLPYISSPFLEWTPFTQQPQTSLGYCALTPAFLDFLTTQISGPQLTFPGSFLLGYELLYLAFTTVFYPRAVACWPA